MKVIFYDVDHGSCCHIITPNNKHILVDIGSKADKSIVDHINKKYFGGIGGRVDELIITHPHEDHIYDLPKLLAKLPPKALQRQKEAFDITPSKHTPLHIKIADCANSMNREYIYPISQNETPTEANNNGGVKFDIITPKTEWTRKDDLNTFSSIVVLSYCGYKFVLTGDNPASVLKKMIDINYEGIKDKISKAVVLLAPHHGRSKEYCEEFFNCVDPVLTVVSDKSIIYDTQSDTSKLYKGIGVELNGEKRYVLTTRNDGTILFEITSDKCYVSLGEEDY